ncbi:hypothetical protein O0I10_007794 [Lichtheimia ornata]|uniref:Nucleoporin Nup133/Nup155-like N-terminal domain-containing protein n=1 Tax=Lichtheimia ornata TaxID=688661 RepID=A0AAD7V2G1_9FUNG|nr:uncharacterized protein O0I10_007794 [Lichtheimia ornata]KAJ8656471.1 hypothetical protein O0I10_007794 [Lichtheimia ornata]
MPVANSPEQKVKAAHEASETLDRVRALDTRLPDVGDLFTASSSGSYSIPGANAVAPFLVKQNITLPPLGLEHLRNWKSDNSAGIFPEIERAFFTVENRLYLWNYMERKDIDTYEESHPIIGVGLVKPKRDIFNPDITHVLVIATTLHINVVAISFKRSPSGATQLTFYRTDMFTSTSGEIISTIIGTKQGRIFMLSKQGRVWELDYRREEGWFTSKCSKRACPGIASYTTFLEFSSEPCIAIAADDEGRVLYQLFESSAIQVTYLGEDGLSFKNVVKNNKIHTAARLMCPSSTDINDFKISWIQPTTPAEAKSYQLVAVTSTGCRLYFTYYSQGSKSKGAPNTLELVHVRTPPPTLPESTYLSSSLYKQGVFIAVGKKEEKQFIAVASPDIGKMSTMGAHGGFSEFTNCLDINGDVISMAEMSATEMGLNELAAQPTGSPRHFLLFTTVGIWIVMKQRPVDILHHLLMSNSINGIVQPRDFQNFFELFGDVNSSALCFQLVCSTSNISMNTDALQPLSTSTDAVKGATQLLETLGQSRSSLSQSVTYSSRHDGLALFISRLIQPVWTKRLLSEKIDAGRVSYNSLLSRELLISTQQILRKLQGFMNLNVTLYPQAESRAPEEHSLRELHDLVVLLSDAISFFLYLLDNNTSKVLTSLKPTTRERFLSSTFKDLITTNDGRSISSDLAFGIIDETLARYGNLDIVIDILEKHCGSFCDASDALLYKAYKHIEAAKGEVSAPRARSALEESLQLLKRIAVHIPYEKVREIAKSYLALGEPVLAVELVIFCVKSREPPHASSTGSEFPAKQEDMMFMHLRHPFYGCLCELLKETMESTSISGSQKSQAFQVVFGVDNVDLHRYLYEQFIHANLGPELIKLMPPRLEEFLQSEPHTIDRIELLADFYRYTEQYEQAAYTFGWLVENSSNVSRERQIDWLTRASVCAKSVSSAAKQFEMLTLQKQLDTMLTELRGYS